MRNFITTIRLGFGLALSLTISLSQSLQADPSQELHYLTYSNTPMGKLDRPLVLRTFMPKADLADEVLLNHHLGFHSPKYSPSKGQDVKGEYAPITGLPAAIGVNYGKRLSYCWDTVECRLLYAWSDGFLDMKKYWGSPDRGNRKGYGYVPDLVGNLFYKATGAHPILVNGMAVKKPKYNGFQQKESAIRFQFKTEAGDEIQTQISPTEKANSFQQHIKLMGEGKLSYSAGNEKTTIVKRISDQEILVTITQETIKTYALKKEKPLTKNDISAVNGEKIFKAMACITCHSVDGAKSHGPTLKGLAGNMRSITGMKEKVLADDAYLSESILTPNKKVVTGFPPNYMPPYKLKENELKSVILYIKSLKNE